MENHGIQINEAMLESISLEVCVRGVIAACCFVGAIAQFPYLLDHTLSTFAPEHLFSNVVYDHIRPVILMGYYAIRFFAYLYFAFVILLKPQERKLLTIGLLLLLCAFAMRAYDHYIAMMTSPAQYEGQWTGTIAALVICAVLADCIVVLYVKPMRIRWSLIGIGVFISAVLLVYYTLCPEGSCPILFSLPLWIDGYTLWSLGCVSLILTIIAVGILFPIWIGRTDTTKQGEMT